MSRACNTSPRPKDKSQRYSSPLGQSARDRAHGGLDDGAINKYWFLSWARHLRTGSEGADNLLYRLAGLCNSTGRCTTSDRRLAEMFGPSERTVTRRLAHLRRFGAISCHFEGGKRVITFNVPPDRQNGRPIPPVRRSASRQDGGQNLRLKINTDLDRAAYARLAAIDDPAARLKALIEFRQRQASGEREG